MVLGLIFGDWGLGVGIALGSSVCDGRQVSAKKMEEAAKAIAAACRKAAAGAAALKGIPHKN